MQQTLSDIQRNHSFFKRLPEFREKVKKCQIKEAHMDKIAKMSQGYCNETIENGCHIWYNLGVFLWKHNRKEL